MVYYMTINAYVARVVNGLSPWKALERGGMPGVPYGVNN